MDSMKSLKLCTCAKDIRLVCWTRSIVYLLLGPAKCSKKIPKIEFTTVASESAKLINITSEHGSYHIYLRS